MLGGLRVVRAALAHPIVIGRAQLLAVGQHVLAGVLLDQPRLCDLAWQAQYGAGYWLAFGLGVDDFAFVVLLGCDRGPETPRPHVLFGERAGRLDDVAVDAMNNAVGPSDDREAGL